MDQQTLQALEPGNRDLAGWLSDDGAKLQQNEPTEQVDPLAA